MDYLSQKPSVVQLTYSPQIQTVVEELLASLTPQNFSVKGLVPYGLTQGHAQKVDKYIWKFHVRCATRLQCRIH